MEREVKQRKKRERTWNGREKKEISFTAEHKDILEHLDGMGNASRYIIDLIKEDIAGHKKSTTEVVEITEVLNDIMKRLERIEAKLDGGEVTISPVVSNKCDLGDKILKSIKVFMDEDE
ncbi:MAG: hypothetical protein K2G70_01525 [Turicibacter sp.]|nr:hypothetical protein [Turicibacter sp.]